MDRGLAIVLTILTGAALGLVEACSGAVDDHHPPVADNQGAMVLPGVAAGGSGGGNTGTTTGSSSGTNGATSGGT
ncbi:MAG: hypothetical protein JWM74_4232, partial [Myxococcaceae bacterium]|nr:hypothetical protein [Myxococcaceae bacterium]